MNQNSIFTLMVSSNLCLLVFILLLEKSYSADPRYEACVPKHCGNVQNITYPFYIKDLQEPFCGYPGFEINCTNNSYPILHIPNNDYIVQEIFYNNQSLRIQNAAFSGSNSRCLPQIKNTTLEGDERFQFANVSEIVLLSNCSSQWGGEFLRYNVSCGDENGGGWDLAMFGDNKNLSLARKACGRNAVVPVDVYGGEEGRDEINGEYVEMMMRRGFMLNWTASDCSVCEQTGGRCGFNTSIYHFRCYCPDRPHVWRCNSVTAERTSNLKPILGAVIPGAVLICFIALSIWHRDKWKQVSYFLSRIKSSESSSKQDLDDASVYFGVPVFTYNELEKATSNFNPSKELGDGGFGTVYHGKLKDGREVAVKRLYESNYKRVQQFMNEIEILTRLRHKNLVSLYGCTSRHSRGLLLVYEYIPNGTVADHLHGDRVDGSLTWPIRMNIAIETATALAYLHASDIIHRDVKTNNILLDDNFCVKVADFGLSRLFPNDVTHVSTAPQGTPGYVDPEYHQSYQLTDKSDVYSFGVVLAELISSMPAVDISRHRHEINLANLALNRIEKSSLNELIDPCLGFETDAAVRRMTTLVAEIVFRCLQLEKEMRPTMDEVLEALKAIHCGDEEKDTKEVEKTDVLTSIRPPPSPESEEVVLLKNIKLPSSPDSVTAIWISSSTTTNTSV